MKKLILILLAALMISACGAEKEPEIFEETNPGENCSIPSDFSSGEEKIPEKEPEFEFEKTEILYPENVPEELFESAAFKQAMERPSVILYDYEPISDCNAAVNFIEAFEKGEYAELYIFRFANIDYYEIKDASCTCFVSENGIITETAEDWQDWETKKDYEYSETVKNVYINDYGFFTVESEIYEPIYYQVIHDFALYENAAEYRELKEKYIDPIFTITVSPEDFGSVSELSDKLIWLFEDIYNYENEHDPWQEFGNNWPVSEMLSLLNRYFEGVTKEMILSRRNIDYDQETDTIFYEGGRGGVYPDRRVFDYEQKDDILTIYYHLYHEESGTIYDDRYFVLEIRILTDGSFRYLSQKIVEEER